MYTLVRFHLRYIHNFCNMLFKLKFKRNVWVNCVMSYPGAKLFCLGSLFENELIKSEISPILLLVLDPFFHLHWKFYLLLKIQYCNFL